MTKGTPCTSAVLYARFSPQPTERAEGKTVEDQHRICRDFCAAKGIEIVGHFADPLASRADDYGARPKLWQAIQAVHKGTALVAYRRDRIGSGRMMYLIDHDVRKRGGQILTVEGGSNEDTPEARLMNDILALLDEYERHRTAARTQALMLAKQASGRRVSAHPPYGWRVDPDDSKRLVEVKAEQDAIARAVDLSAKGTTTNQIAAVLAEEGYASRTERWHANTVRRILIREGIIERRKAGG